MTNSSQVNNYLNNTTTVYKEYINFAEVFLNYFKPVLLWIISANIYIANI